MPFSSGRRMKYSRLCFSKCVRKVLICQRSLPIPDSGTKQAIRSVIVLLRIKDELCPYQEKLNYIQLFDLLCWASIKCLVLHLKMRKSRSKCLQEIKHAPSPTVSLLYRSTRHHAAVQPFIYWSPSKCLPNLALILWRYHNIQIKRLWKMNIEERLTLTVCLLDRREL